MYLHVVSLKGELSDLIMCWHTRSCFWNAFSLRVTKILETSRKQKVLIYFQANSATRFWNNFFRINLLGGSAGHCRKVLIPADLVFLSDFHWIFWWVQRFSSFSLTLKLRNLAKVYYLAKVYCDGPRRATEWICC